MDHNNTYSGIYNAYQFYHRVNVNDAQVYKTCVWWYSSRDGQNQSLLKKQDRKSSVQILMVFLNILSTFLVSGIICTIGQKQSSLQWLNI